MGREQLLNQIASDSGSPSRSSTTKTTSNSDSKAAGRDRLLKQIGGYGSKTALDEDKYSEFENLYNQYESDVSGIYDSYNARAKKTGYKSGAQDFYDKTMAATTAARTSSSALTDWLNKNRDSFSYDDYTELIGAIKQNQTGLDKILDEAKSDAELYTRGRGSESGLRSQWLKNNGVRVAPWRPSKSELETWTEDYVKANQELKDAQKALKKITPTEGMTLDDAQREYGTARIAAQQRVDDAQDKLDELGAKIEKYGGAVPKTELSANDWFNAVRYGFRSGITSADQAIAKGLDFFLGDALGELQTLGGETVRLFNPDFDYNEKNLLDRYVDWSQSHLDVQRERAAEAVGINRTAQKVNQYTEMVFNSLPMSVMAIMSGGATAAPQASTEALQIASAIANSGKAQQLLTPVLNAVKNMANDPNWQFTFMSTVGESYEDALADGASNEDAVINALLNAAANATIEVGGGDEELGGLQKLPKPLREALQRGDKSGVLRILKSIPSEAGEEIMQGIAEAGIKGIYKDVPLFSMNDEGAVISPSRMLDEAKGAAVVSAVLGGGQYAAEAGLNAAERSRANKEADAVAKQLYGDSADTLVQQGLESPVDSKSYKLARQYQTILDNNGELSGKQIRKLVQANSEQIRTEGETEAQAQTGAGEEAAQQTAPQTQSTPAARTNTETGAQTATQQTRPTGAMEAIYKGQVGNVVSLTKTDKGWAATIEQPNGKRSNVMEWQAVFDPDTQGILDAFRPSAYADEMLKTYALTDEQVEPKTYALAFNTVADIYGKSTSLTRQQAQEASRRDGGAAAILTDEQFSRAFDAGRNSKDSSIQNSVTRKSSKGAVGFKGVQYQGMTYRAATKDMVSDAELSVLKTMSKAVGVDMVLYQSEEQNGEYQGANGFYRNGTVYLDVHAGATKTTEQSAILLTAAHELTHYLRENNAEAYTELQDFVMQHLIESGTDIETLAKKKVDKERGLISMEDAAEEVIADSCEMMLENTQVPQMMAKENPGLFAQIREWLAEFAAKLRRAFEGVQARSAEAQAMMQYAEELQQMWDNALAGAAQNVRNNTQNARNNARNNAQAETDNGTNTANNGTNTANNGTDSANNGTTSGRGKASIRELDGERVAWVDEDITRSKPKDVSMEKYVKQYIENMISQNGTYLGTLPDSGMRVFAETQGRTPKSRYGLADEYVRSSYTRWIKDNSKNKFRAKMKAAGVLDDLVSIATDRTWEKTKHTQNKDAQYGVYNYNSTFAFPVYDSKGELSNVRAYDCQMVILNASDGKKYLYDVMRIKENTAKANDFLLAERQRVANEATRQGDVSDNSISRSAENDNTKFSQRERDEDLQKKYQKLNLNEDISKLDGVPAIELTDGSVLPILDRDRYPTHVSFIEGNRIDVDDLRSGGWIGDGVYDPSFTSDTARYIERKQAGKRVAELRGVPFNQFEDDGKSSMREQTDKDRDKRQTEINQEIEQLKKTREELLNANPDYLAAAEQRRYASTFTERVSANKAIKAAEAEVDTAEIDSQIEELRRERDALRDAEKREYEAAREKYSGAKTRGYSRYADTRTAELDSEYEQAVKSGDKKKQRALVFEAAERAMPNSVIRGGDGKLKPVYHYTNNNFTKFDRSRARTGNEMDGFFFAPDTESTREYGSKRISAFLNITNPAYDPYLDRKHNDSGTLLREKLAYEGYDGVIRTENGQAYEYMAFDPEQIKSAELITYDDAGNVIPLSERFNSERDDIRYSMRDNTTDDTAAERKGRQESYANLRAENAKLREQLDYWKGQTKRTKEKTVRKTDADAYAKRLTEQLHNPKAREQVADEIKRMGDYIVQTPGSELSYTEVKDWALAIADYVLQDSQTVIDDSQAESLQQLYGYLKDNKLRVTDDTFNDLPEGWVRQHRGRIKLSEDGLDVDTAWGELQEKFGEGMFPSDITAQADMLMHIADTIEAMKPTYGNPFAGYMGEMREAVAQDILDTVLSDEIRQTAMTAADRAQARLDKRIAQDTARYNALRDEKNARIEQIERESRERYNALREKKNQRIEQIKKEGTERTKKAVQRERTFQLQRVERAQKVKSIEKLTKSLSKKMIENNAKYHIPDALKEPIGKFLMSIDTTTSRSGEKARNEFADRLKRVSEVLEAQRKYNQGEGTEGSNVYYDLPPDFTEQMQELANKVKFWTDYNNGKEWKLEDMDLRDLFELENIVKVVSHAVTQANELLSMNTSVDDVGQEAVQYLDKLGEMKTTPGGAEEFLDYKNLTPVYFFKRFGTAGEKIFNTLKDGWSKLAFNSKEIIDFAKTLYSTEEVRDAEKNVIELQLHRRVNENENSEALRTEETEPVYMTKAQIMNLYGLSLREQALTHLLGAGIHIKDIKRAGKKALHQGDNYLLTMEELTDIFNEHLTNRDREIVQGMQKFMSTVCAKWYMEVNQKRWGIDGNVEENYWPIETDSRNRQAKGTEGAGSTISLFRLANMGFTKPIKPNSTNAINIGSAFDVFANHAADMAKYNSMVIPVLDAMKWLSYSNIVATSATSGQYTTMSVQKAMDKTYGPAAQAYFTQLIRDINGSHEGGSVRTGLEGMTARYKRQAVGSNLRVALLQPTAYARAGMVLDLKYLAMGGVKQNQIIKSYKEAIKHSGTATWKSLGFYDVNINASLRSLIKQDETAVDKVVGWSMKLAELGDQWTWAMLWNACKTEQQDKAKRAGKKLDYETLMQKTSERFDEVVYQTQVMDSTLTRSEIMRSDDRLVKAATSFMAEPTLSYNTVLNMYDEYRREARAVGKSAAWKKLGNKIMRGIGIYVTQATLGAVVESIMDAWRDDDDYMTFMEKWAEKFWGDYFFDGNLYGDLTVVGKLPVVKDFISALQGEESSRMDTEGLASLYKFGLTSYNKIKAMIEDGEDTTKVTAWGWIEQGLRAASQLLGLPGYNLTREVVAVWNNTIGQWTDSKIRRYKPQPEKEIKNAYLKGYLTEDEAKELLMDRETMGDKTYMIERQALMAIDDWTDNGEKYKALYTALENKDRKAYDEAFDALKESGHYAYDIQTKVRAQIKEWYVGDKRGNGKYKINKEDAVAMLKEYGNMTDYDAESAVHTWTCKVVEGFDYNEKKDLFYAGDLSFADAVKVVERYGKNDKGKFLSDIDDGYDEARKEVLKWTMRTEVGIDYDDMRSAYNDGDITIEQVAEWSKKYGSLDDEAIETRCYRWEWTKDTPEASGIFEGQARRYDAYVASTGMTKEQYFNLVDGHGTNTFSGDLKPGSTTSYVPNSKRDKAWAYIDSLKITPEEKDALAMCYAAENGDGIDKPSKRWMKLEDAPWNN